MTDVAHPYLTERVFGESGWTQVWMVPPPDVGVRYRVIRQEWNDDDTVRTILEIEIAP